MSWRLLHNSAEEKENDPVEVCEEIPRSFKKSGWVYMDDQWCDAEMFIRFSRWTAGYDVMVRHNLGHIVKSDSHDITVAWCTRSSMKVLTGTFSRGDETVKPMKRHVVNVLENGLSKSVDYEYDEEKVDSDGNFLHKVMFHQIPRY